MTAADPIPTALGMGDMIGPPVPSVRTCGTGSGTILTPRTRSKPCTSSRNGPVALQGTPGRVSISVASYFTLNFGTLVSFIIDWSYWQIYDFQVPFPGLNLPIHYRAARCLALAGPGPTPGVPGPLRSDQEL